MKILQQVYHWTRKTPLNFGSHPDQESGSGPRVQLWNHGLRIWTTFALVEVCALRLLLLLWSLLQQVLCEPSPDVGLCECFLLDFISVFILFDINFMHLCAVLHTCSCGTCCAVTVFLCSTCYVKFCVWNIDFNLAECCMCPVCWRLIILLPVLLLLLLYCSWYEMEWYAAMWCYCNCNLQ